MKKWSLQFGCHCRFCCWDTDSLCVFGCPKTQCVDSLASESKGTACLCFPRAWIKGLCLHTQPCYTGTHVFYIVRKKIKLVYTRKERDTLMQSNETDKTHSWLGHMILNLRGTEPGMFGVLSSSRNCYLLCLSLATRFLFFLFSLYITLYSALLAITSTCSRDDFFINLV